MLVEASAKDFERSPLGRFTCTGSAVVWVDSASLGGWHIWGRPDEDETRTLLTLLAAYPKLAGTFDLIADTRGVEMVNPTALSLLVPWVFQHRKELKRRVRVQANVIRRDSVGFLLMGIIGSVGDVYPLRTYTDPVEAFRSVAGDAGELLCGEIESIVTRVRATPMEVQTLRTLLTSDVATTIRSAAKTLSTSPRSLQRVLAHHGTSFHDEQTSARFTLAKSLLTTTESKVSGVAARVGWSERTLTSIFRARTGLTPADWRKRPHT
ncbi:MAG: helix-turn-helix domain-containing protein [Polyangiaceae bacterium]